MAGKELALSLTDIVKKDATLLSRPITTLTKMAGLKASDVYSRLIPALCKTEDISEALRYAETGLKYAAMVDRNRLREEIGEEFVLTLELIINLVKEGLDSEEDFVKRKAMSLHRELIDEHSEKKRFIETVMIEDKLAEIVTAQEAQRKLSEEIIDL